MPPAYAYVTSCARAVARHASGRRRVSPCGQRCSGSGGDGCETAARDSHLQTVVPRGGRGTRRCRRRAGCLVPQSPPFGALSPPAPLGAQLIGARRSGVRSRRTAKARRCSRSASAASRSTCSCGARSTRPPARERRRSSSRSTTRAAGEDAHTTEDFAGTCGRYDGPGDPGHGRRAARRPTGRTGPRRAGSSRCPNLGFTPWTSQLSQQLARGLALDGRLAKLETRLELGLRRPLPEPLRPADVPRQPVYGFGTTQFGAPTDGFGRLIYLDTFNSAYGPGWKRENSFVPHNPTGVFCYGFYSFDPTKGGYQHPPG